MADENWDNEDILDPLHAGPGLIVRDPRAVGYFHNRLKGGRRVIVNVVIMDNGIGEEEGSETGDRRDCEITLDQVRLGDFYVVDLFSREKIADLL